MNTSRSRRQVYGWGVSPELAGLRFDRGSRGSQFSAPNQELVKKHEESVARSKLASSDGRDAYPSYRSTGRKSSATNLSLSNLILAPDASTAFLSGLELVLGRSVPETTLDPMIFRVSRMLSELNMEMVKAGYQHSLGISAEGHVYTWGYAPQAQHSSALNDDASRPQIIKDLALARAYRQCQYVGIACGSENSYVLTDQGEVYAWGGNQRGQLGMGLDNDAYIDAPKVILPLHSTVIRQIECGSFHCACVSDKGELYTFGYGGSGRLGHDDTEDRPSPEKVKAFENDEVSSVACGGSHTVVCLKDGRVFTFGKGENGQLGNGDQQFAKFPQLVAVTSDGGSLPPVEKVFAGYSHTAVLTKCGKVYFWGGGLGPNNLPAVSLPQLLDLFDGIPVVTVECGENSLLILLKNHSLYVVRDICAVVELGTGLDNVFRIRGLSGKRIRCLSANVKHTLIVVQDETDLHDSHMALSKRSLRVNTKTSSGSVFSTTSSATTATGKVIPESPDIVTPGGTSRKRGQTSSSKKKNQREIEAVRFWEEFVEDGRPLRFKQGGKFDVMVREGIPSHLRAAVWPLLIENRLMLNADLYEHLKKRVQERKELFHLRKSKERFNKSKKGEQEQDDLTDSGGSGAAYASSERQSQVILDLARTMPDLALFHRSGPFNQSLQEVLEVFEYFRPDVGYVQGMSFIAGVFLLHGENAMAFQCVANVLLRDFVMRLYELDVDWTQHCFNVCQHYFEENIPQLYLKFKTIVVSPDMYLTEWLITLFSKSLPLHITCRIWDRFFAFGEHVLFEASLAILKYFLDPLRKGDFESVLLLLNHIPKDIDEDEFFHIMDTISINQKDFDERLYSSI